MIEQRVDWADPVVQDVYFRLHRQDQWRTSRASLTAVTLLALIGGFQLMWLHRWGWLLATGAGLALILLRVQLMPCRLRRLLPSTDGVHWYRLEERTLHIRNAAGEHEIALSDMTRLRSYAGGLVVQYADTSTFTLPDGPVRHGLERRLRQPPASPGATPSLDG